MDQLRSLNATAGQSIPAILMPTFQIFTPLLLKNKSSILAVPQTTQSYGAHPRQKLDIYYSTTSPSSSPILIFFYGGGLIRGDKIIDAIPERLVYHNLGSFFAKRGITTLIPDYRRVDSEFGGEGAVFPSGGEDVSLVLQWLEGFGKERKKEIYIMGNSAGGVHISTFMFEERFWRQRQELAKGEKGVLLKGAIELSVPFHFSSAQPERSDMLVNYYGSVEKAREDCAFGLLKKVKATGRGREEAAVPKTLVMLAEFDPKDEIVEPIEEFVELWEETWGEKLMYKKMKGHNHISPPMALGSGDVEAEEWGEGVVKWISAN